MIKKTIISLITTILLITGAVASDVLYVKEPHCFVTDNVSNMEYIFRGMHLTQPPTTCSMSAWKTIPKQSWSLSDVFRRTKHAINTCLTCGGHAGFLARGVVIT